MDTNEMVREFIDAFPQVVGEYVKAQLGKQIQHTLTARDADRLNQQPGNSYHEGQVVSARITGMSVSTDSDRREREYVDLRLDSGAELTTVPFNWTESL